MNYMKEGIYTGIDTQNQNLIVLNGLDEKYFSRTKTNNWLKMHGKPMMRKPFKRKGNFIVIGQSGRGMSFTLKLNLIRETPNYIFTDPKGEFWEREE